MNHLKDSLLELTEKLMEADVLKGIELQRYINEGAVVSEPEALTEEMEKWYKTLGIEMLMDKKLKLSKCPFITEEIIEAHENGEFILCVPKDVDRITLGKIFHIDSWVLSDKLATAVPEKEDLWFKTSLRATPINMKKTGNEVFYEGEEDGKIQFSIERYLVFIGRYRYLMGQTPDKEYWIWLPHGRYDRSGMLMAGFDRFQRFNVHGWMPHFSASYLGCRYGELAKN